MQKPQFEGYMQNVWTGWDRWQSTDSVRLYCEMIQYACTVRGSSTPVLCEVVADRKEWLQVAEKTNANISMESRSRKRLEREKHIEKMHRKRIVSRSSITARCAWAPFWAARCVPRRPRLTAGCSHWWGYDTVWRATGRRLHPYTPSSNCGILQQTLQDAKRSPCVTPDVTTRQQLRLYSYRTSVN